MAGREEYKVQALNPIGNYLGGCYLKLSRDDIAIFDHKKTFIGNWPYNCIRQFREEKDVFAFTSGRRGPYGVNEYLFQMSPERLEHLKQVISNYTGTKFQGLDDGPVSSDEILPYHHSNSPPHHLPARRSSSGKSDKSTPSPKIRSRSASRQKMDSSSSSGNSYDKSPIMKLRAESLQPSPSSGTTLRNMFGSARQLSLPDTTVRSVNHHGNGGKFQNDLKASLARPKCNDSTAHGYVNGHTVTIGNLKTSPKPVRYRMGSESSSEVSPPRDLPSKLQRTAPPPPVAKKPSGLPRRFFPTTGRGFPGNSRLRKAKSVGSLLEVDDEENTVSEVSVGDMLLDDDVIFGSMKDQHHFGSRVSPRHTPSPGPSSPTPLDDYVLINGSNRPPVSKPIPAPRRRAATVNRTSYENAEIVELHKNGLLRKQLRSTTVERSPRQHVTHGNQDDIFDGQLSPDFSLDDYEHMASVKQLDADDYVTMKSVDSHVPDEYELMKSHVVGRQKIQKYSDVPPPIGRLQKSNSAHSLLVDKVYDTPRNVGYSPQNPMARSGYDHLAAPGVKSGKGKKSILLQKNNPFKGQPKKHIVTAC